MSFSTAVLVGLKRPFHEYAFNVLFFRPLVTKVAVLVRRLVTRLGGKASLPERTFNTSDPVAALSMTGCRRLW